jgi:hypothetical protein
MEMKDVRKEMEREKLTRMKKWQGGEKGEA